MSEAPSPLKPVLRIDFPPEERLGHGKIELMELIVETGSISAAGRAMDMSYRRAWLLVDALNHMFRQPVIESQRGGKQGGGAALTAFGTEVLERYRGMEKRMNEALRADIDWLEANRNPDAALNKDREPPTL
ncbi:MULTISPECIES: winged helix-turn-helix domain-containing protein [Rhizobium/Agrobacterium group]|uniref:LysR family transcriptional regulator n=1 Tax=Agrobacterium tumefaciens TaxID=358 RepID=A0A4D7YTX5_AGRTU|nr:MULTISPECIES: winged helix-turn-helix domain-containing protein [Rhizobium/Agrobacterium group]MBB4403198.1 molybdate transport system regulatory protein [Agrobacterium radiobacter]MBB5589660.1 molybdate transport system regulatory protein [Agrobacterium radiobacter]QCL94712.1 LysR family transcriptional regulator [Agrobacterium tumefaciens]RVT78132.1 LysR family transcriptional regulator [Agrobacterium sp. CNPSo 2736]TGE87653.1 transcriptional regulator [Rhizobium sp. SEMIA 4032]